MPTKCSLCNAPNVNKTTCPMNPNAKFPRPEVHNTQEDMININKNNSEEIKNLTQQNEDLNIQLQSVTNHNSDLVVSIASYKIQMTDLIKKYYKEVNEADLYYSRWYELKEKHIRESASIKLIPRIQKELLKTKTDFEECSICLESMHKDDYCMTVCGHEFHNTCLDRSIQTMTSDSCPTCRH